MTRIAAVLSLAVSCAALAACNEMAANGVAPTTAAVVAPPSSFALPAGAPCSGEIGRYQAILRDDLQTGNVERKVYDQIQGEMKRAADACAAGRGGEAHSLVAASKARHGYRA